MRANISHEHRGRLALLWNPIHRNGATWPIQVVSLHNYFLTTAHLKKPQYHQLGAFGPSFDNMTVSHFLQLLNLSALYYDNEVVRRTVPSLLCSSILANSGAPILWAHQWEEEHFLQVFPTNDGIGESLSDDLSFKISFEKTVSYRLYHE